MSADRRTMTIAAVAMVALILVGVVSAALFTRSACDTLQPEPTEAGAAGSDVEAVLASALDDLDPAQIAAAVDGMASVVGAVGHVAAAADVGEATRLSELDGRLVALGEDLTLLDGPGTLAARAQLPGPATVTGEGDRLFALAVANELTAQLDAIVPVVPGLVGGDCLDAAQVGVPLAFHLDAGGGQLLLFRVDDDGDGPEVELRDATAAAWSQDLELGAGSPGVLAERLTGHLGDELVVTTRRALPDESAPAVQTRSREDGALRWSLAPQELDGLAPGGQDALLPDVVAISGSHVLVAIGREGRDRRLLVGLDARDGSTAWTSDLMTDGAPRVAGALDGGLVLLAPRAVDDREDDLLPTREVVRVDPDDGAATILHTLDGAHTRGAVAGNEVILAVDEGLSRIGPDDTREVRDTGVEFVDVRAVDGGVALLLRSDDGGAVVWLEIPGGTP